MSDITETKEANQLGSMVEIQMELMTAGDLELESEGGMPGNEAESCDSNAMQRSNLLVSDAWIQRKHVGPSRQAEIDGNPTDSICGDENDLTRSRSFKSNLPSLLHSFLFGSTMNWIQSGLRRRSPPCILSSSEAVN
jgi:hypothetical protein